MKFELIGKHKATLVDVDIQSLKMGQTDVVPAVALTFKSSLPNFYLNMLDKTLLPFLFVKGNAAQSTLDGVPAVSDLPSLSNAATKFGTLSWGDDQSGSKLVIYQGITGDGDIRLKDGDVNIKKIEPREGGAIDLFFRYYSSDLDAETLGELAVLKSHDLDIELVAAEVVNKQPELDVASKSPPKNAKPENPFPVDADKPSTRAADSPFTPEQALANAVAGDKPAPTVTKRTSRLKAVAT